MIRVTFVHPRPDGACSSQTVSCRTGTNLMQAAVEASVKGIEADCGGSLTCATCHVYVQEPWLGMLPAPVPDEDSMLDFTAQPRSAHSRLSCQIVLTEGLDGLTVEVPKSQY